MNQRRHRSLVRRRIPSKSHLAEAVQVRDRLLHRGRRPADGVEAVRLEQGVARRRLVEEEEGGHDGNAKRKRPAAAFLEEEMGKERH